MIKSVPIKPHTKSHKNLNVPTAKTTVFFVVRYMIGHE